MNAAPRKTEALAVLEQFEPRVLLSGDVMTGAILSEPSIPGGDLNNVAITAQTSGDNTSAAGQSEQDLPGAEAAPEAVQTQLVGFRAPGVEIEAEAFKPPFMPAPEVGGTYMLTDHWGGTMADAEKDYNNPECGMMCWAAAASNVLEWTGWGFVNGMTTTDQMFQYFQDHWTDEGGRMRYGWDWWFDGTYTGPWTPGWSQVDVPGGGFHPTETFGDYFHHQMIDANAMAAVDTFLHAGYGTTLGLAGGGSYGHAVTCWGYTFNPSNPDEYLGVWVSDSDDNKFDGSPPDVLAYYDVAYSNNHWYLQNYGGGAWYIDVVDALDRNPNHRPDLYDAGEMYSWFAPDEVPHGEPWEAHFDIRNGSIADAGAFYVDFYASQNTTITTNDYFLGRVSVSGVAAGAKANADLVLSQLPLTLPVGSYYVGIIIDPTNVVDEFNETNNTGVDTDDYPLHVEAPAWSRIEDIMWIDQNPIGPSPRTDLTGTEYFSKFDDPATRSSLDRTAEPTTTLDEYLTGGEDDTFVRSGGLDTLGEWDRSFRTDAEFYSGGGDWITSDLAGQHTFPDASAPELVTLEQKL